MIYNYKAFKSTGESASGTIEASDPKDAKVKLRMQNMFVTEITDATPGAKPRLLSLPKFTSTKKLTEISAFTRQLATLLHSGIALTEALNALIEQTDSLEWRGVITGVRDKVTQGSSFAEAISGHPHYFNDLYVNMVKAGEASGNLDKVLSRLADYIHGQARLRSKVSAALIYPAIMIVVGSCVVLFLFLFVIPQILVVLEKQNIPKPLPTQILVGLTSFLTHFWWLLFLAGIAIFTAIKLFIATPKGRLFYDGFILKVPVLGQLFRKQAISRFASTFGTLLESGIPAMDALGIVKTVVGNVVIANVIEDVRAKIMEGADISTPLKKGKIFPPVVSYMIAIGEQSGNLEELLRRIAEEYDEEIEVTTQKITALLEPVIIVVMALLVGFVALSILLPILTMSKIH
ncbi:MAG: type II secretion system F family protein [Planctomycetes bacterium]|nr:type II secretion system F family protein [Planctomycetota bacterium]